MFNLACDADCLRIWEIAGTWVAGLGSVAAVIVALRLATWDQKVHLRVTANIGLMLGSPGADPHQRYIWVSVTNIGRRTATLNNICLRCGLPWSRSPFLPARHAVLLFDPSLSTPTPVTLRDGESASYFVKIEQATYHTLLEKPFGVSSRLMTFFASDALGNQFHVKPSKDLRKHMQESAEKATPAPAD